MSRGRTGAARQLGQAMAEYALIMATVVAGFAVASQAGVYGGIVDTLQQIGGNYNIFLPTNLDELKDSAKRDDFNHQIVLR